ncbi:hypothetical protein ZWY2020_044155 [Hordeum vulgare]|nr:hypothetical protein ZWY2020_044155 [Hordeum vulgare]
METTRVCGGRPAALGHGLPLGWPAALGDHEWLPELKRSSHRSPVRTPIRQARAASAPFRPPPAADSFGSGRPGEVS